jgi:hypothetical protein
MKPHDVPYENASRNVNLGTKTITAGGFVGNVTGNADTATKLAATKTINGVAFDGSTNINIPSITWSVVTSDGNLAVDTGTIANKGTLLTLTLPSTCAVGKMIRLVGMNAGLWKISQNANQIIHFGSTDTTTGAGGSIASTLAYDAVELVCCKENLEFVVVSCVGNITIV